MPPAARSREVRLALVLNGGVSLAIWIGGVTREIDAARRATPGDDDDTSPLYHALFTALDQDVVVDVIGGASAGGINGVLLAAAIYNDVPLGDLRETWISLGDFRTLLRSPTLPNPPSLMKGEEVVLPALEKELNNLWSGNVTSQNWLYLYVTATDLFGYDTAFHDSEGRTFAERDHRRVFTFQHEAATAPIPVSGELTGTMRRVVWFNNDDARELLVRAARGSSSFPVAFEAHGLKIEDDEVVVDRWLVDGGILDNQPFNPVLDRISVLPGDRPVKRSVMYVVPYVTEVGEKAADVPLVVTARATYSAASSLPRDLPKLQGLKRVEHEAESHSAAAAERLRMLNALPGQNLVMAATALFESYRAARIAASQVVFELWAHPDFQPGTGVIAQDPAQSLPPLPRTIAPSPLSVVPWVPNELAWPSDDLWQWGLAPAERVAGWALLLFRDADEANPEIDLVPHRSFASHLVALVRDAKVEARAAFRLLPRAEDQLARASEAYTQIAETLVELESQFVELDGLLSSVGRSVQRLLYLEVVLNGVTVQDDETPRPFDFVFASAGVRNSLGHQAEKPAAKLAGLKLGHFAGFLKRSWRANDWLWGRLDGVEHVLRATVDAKRLGELDVDVIAPALAELALALDLDESAEERAILAQNWNVLLRRFGLTYMQTPDPQDSYEAAVSAAATLDETSGKQHLGAVRAGLAARIQLRIIASDLGRVAQTARDDITSGASRTSSGAYWAARFSDDSSLTEQVALFRQLDMGSESPAQEASSRLVFDVGSQLAAVVAALFAGDRGGMPGPARAALASIRGLTLATSRIVQLLAREPWLGAAVFAALVGLVIWAGVAKSTIVGALLPALAILVILVGFTLITIGTSVFDLPLRRPARWLGTIAFISAPLAFGILGLLYTPLADWLNSQAGPAAAVGSAGAAVAAAAAGIAAAFIPTQSLRGKLLWIYRLAVTGALLLACGGFLVERWVRNAHGQKGATGWAAVANERHGTILVVVLVATLLAASALLTLVAWSRERRASTG